MYDSVLTIIKKQKQPFYSWLLSSFYITGLLLHELLYELVKLPILLSRVGALPNKETTVKYVLASIRCSKVQFWTYQQFYLKSYTSLGSLNLWKCSVESWKADIRRIQFSSVNSHMVQSLSFFFYSI